MVRTKVLIIDDSAVMRQLLSEILSRDPSLEVVGVAQDPFVARDKIKALNPDVLTLDVEMPRMDGLAFLERLMRAHPMPVVMVSSLTQRGAETTLRAMELGAVDFVGKPTIDMKTGMLERTAEIVEKVKSAALARVRPATHAPGARPDSVGFAGPPTEHLQGDRDRGFHGGDLGLARISCPIAARHAGHRGGAAHARSFHAFLRQPPGFGMPGKGEGGGRRRRDPSGACPDRAG